MSAALHNLAYAPALIRVPRSERPANPPDSCATDPNGAAALTSLDGKSSEIPGALALSLLKSQILEFNDKSISSHDFLFIVISNFLPAALARDHASRLLERFGSLGAILSASKDRINAVTNDLDELWIILRCVHSAIATILREPIENKPLLGDQASLHDYLRISLAHECREVVRLLFLNSKNALILDECHSKGTVNHTPIYPREVIQRVLEVGANALIIVHNHPSGDPTPSHEDREMTRVLSRVLNEIGVALHDHVVVGLRRCVSMRSLGMI